MLNGDSMIYLASEAIVRIKDISWPGRQESTMYEGQYALTSRQIATA